MNIQLKTVDGPVIYDVTSHKYSGDEGYRVRIRGENEPIGIVNRMVEWEAWLETPVGMKKIEKTFDYKVMAIEAVVKAWHERKYRKGLLRVIRSEA